MEQSKLFYIISILSHTCERASERRYRVADVGVDVVLDVFQHFVEVAGTRRTQEAGVTIALSTRTCTRTHIHTDRQTDRETYRRLQQLTAADVIIIISPNSRNQAVTTPGDDAATTCKSWCPSNATHATDATQE